MYPWLLVGQIERAATGQTKKTLRWEVPALRAGLNPPLENLFQAFSVGGGAGIVTKNGTLVFPVKAVTKEGKEVSLVMYSSDPEENWRLSRGMSAGGCVDPAVVEWGSGRLLMMASCEEGHRSVYESGDMGETWTEALGTLSRVWGNSPERDGSGVQGGFVAATIEERNVMLVTLPAHSTAKTNGQLHLWLTDAAHVVDVGPVSDASKHAAGSALLHTGGKDLISLQELYSVVGDAVGVFDGIYLARLTDMAERVKSVVRAWREADSNLPMACTQPVKSAAGKGDCGVPMPTAGLVGFLSGTVAGGQWKDEYLGVNATVRGVARTASNGLTFNGGGAGAEWPVGRQGQNQRFHFANYNFTLVATVSIDAVPTGGRGIPVMGARLSGEGEGTILLGLSCAADGWEVTFNGVKTMQGVPWRS
ncbi:trans-sialidase, partial [Trypanosoma conorhini]